MIMGLRHRTAVSNSDLAPEGKESPCLVAGGDGERASNIEREIELTKLLFRPVSSHVP